jgi:uncharacterized protein (DUF983 family)
VTDTGPDAMALIRQAIACQCPRCGKANIYKSRSFFNLSLCDKCPACGLELAQNDNGDGPAVFLIFILGFSLVPLALIIDHFLSPPSWLLTLVLGAVALGLTLGLLRPLKAYVIALQFKHRPGNWKQD